MKKISVLDRIIFLVTAHLAGYQIVSGIEGFDTWSTIYYTIAFGVLLLACFLIVLFGYGILENVTVVAIATLIPLGLSMGILSRYIPEALPAYQIFAAVGLLLIILTRVYRPGKVSTAVLAVVHGIAGLIIFIMPIALSISGKAHPLFSLVGIGGALVGVDGLLRVHAKTGKPIVSKETLHAAFPYVMLVITALFVVGMGADKG